MFRASQKEPLLRISFRDFAACTLLHGQCNYAISVALLYSLQSINLVLNKRSKYQEQWQQFRQFLGRPLNQYIDVINSMREILKNIHQEMKTSMIFTWTSVTIITSWNLLEGFSGGSLEIKWIGQQEWTTGTWTMAMKHGYEHLPVCCRVILKTPS